ncbi:MAG: BON domain-containing protein [Rhodanobacter sp.]
MDSNQPGSDTWITTKVKAELATTDGVESSDLSVKTVNGVVTITGVLDSDVAVKKAVAAAQGIKGVTQVDSSGLKVK